MPNPPLKSVKSHTKSVEGPAPREAPPGVRTFLVGALFMALNVGTGGRFGPADLGADPPPI